ncbi:hypothetical protein HMPREF1568_2265 [Providencia alcalifaciens PAL-3]|nr:hypothetical protein HMPREF1568_2265 [Providencia alcalifaciens PAL-3]EUC98033.1 hypothetical protein HMPREF1566_0937 [Providencia alcalifaciens PAL-1]
MQIWSNNKAIAKNGQDKKFTIKNRLAFLTICALESSI